MIVVSAPSGAGKTTVLARVLRDLGGIRFSVSHTTRPPRGAERDGVEYHFVDQEASSSGCARRGRLLEWAEVHGNLYGTGVAEIERASARASTSCSTSTCRARRRCASASRRR